MQSRVELNYCKTLKANRWGEALCLCSYRMLTLGQCLIQVNTALLCTFDFYQQLELPVCPLLGDVSHPDFCFKARGFEHPCFPCPFVAGLKKRTCSQKTCRPSSVTQTQSLLEAEARLPSSEVFVQHCA